MARGLGSFVVAACKRGDLHIEAVASAHRPVAYQNCDHHCQLRTNKPEPVVNC